MGTKVLIIGTVWAERHASAAGVRMWRLIDVLRSAGYTVVFGSAAQSGSARDELEASHIFARSGFVVLDDCLPEDLCANLKECIDRNCVRGNWRGQPRDDKGKGSRFSINSD